MFAILCPKALRRKRRKKRDEDSLLSYFLILWSQEKIVHTQMYYLYRPSRSLSDNRTGAEKFRIVSNGSLFGGEIPASRPSHTRILETRS